MDKEQGEDGCLLAQLRLFLTALFHAVVRELVCIEKSESNHISLFASRFLDIFCQNKPVSLFTFCWLSPLPPPLAGSVTHYSPCFIISLPTFPGDSSKSFFV